MPPLLGKGRPMVHRPTRPTPEQPRRAPRQGASRPPAAGRYRHRTRERRIPYRAAGYNVAGATTVSTTIAIDVEQQRILELINRRLDELDAAAAPAVPGILTAAHRLPPADRIYVHRRLMALGHPDVEWAADGGDSPPHRRGRERDVAHVVSAGR